MPLSVAILTTDKREHDKDYGNPMPTFGTAPEALLQGFAVLPDVNVHVVSCHQLPVKSPEKIGPNIWYHALHVPKIGWMRTGYQGCLRAVRQRLKEINPDIVHGQGTERDCALTAVWSGFPNVLTIHGNMRLIAQLASARMFSYLWLAARLEGLTLPRSDGVVCITRYTQEAVSAVARKTWVVPNAVDQTFFDIVSQPPADEPPVILFVGAVCARKNQNAFIRSLDSLASRTDFRVVFLGQVDKDDSYGNEFLKLIESRKWCAYEGFANREKLKTYFAGASLVVLPSLEDNCPMVVLEAMAAGVPVMASKVGGIPDLIDDEKNGLFCNPHDAASMERGVARLLKEKELSRQLATEANRRAREQFHPSVIARRHVEIYRGVLKRDS